MKAPEYSLQDINTKDIFVNDKAQRDVNRRRAQFNKIMRNFNQNLVQPVSVALIDGKYWCMDGQMTIKVLKARNGGKDLCVKCRVYYGLTHLDAAQMFIEQRGVVSRVTLLDKIRVNSNFGDEKARAFEMLTEKNGLEISWSGHKSKNSVIAVSTLWDEFTAMNDYDLYGSFIRLIKGAWNGDPEGAQANILKGVGLFVRTYKGQYEEDLFIKKLAVKRPSDIIRDAQADRSKGARKYAVQILIAYNYGQREEKRLPNLL